MKDVVITPRREKSEPRLPPCGTLLINPAEARYAVGVSRRQGWRRFFLFHSNLSVAAGSSPFFWAGPAVGAPMAVLCLEKLIALGARQIIAFGWCGALNRNLAVGDVFLPTWAVSEEGTSSHYPVAGPLASSASLRAALEALLSGRGGGVKTGPIWTTDAPYRETRDKVRRYGEQGIWAVDMEFSALAAVAAFRGVEFAAQLVVSDVLWQEKWRPGHRDKGFREDSQRLVEGLFASCRELGRDVREFF